MYSNSGVDTKAPLIFKINPYNKSGKKMLDICDGQNNDVWFSNTSSICSGGGANSVKPIDLDFVKRALTCKEWDLIVFGGKLSVGVYKANFSELTNVVLMPHPAARSFTNRLKDDIRAYIAEKTFLQAREFEL